METQRTRVRAQEISDNPARYKECFKSSEFYSKVETTHRLFPSETEGRTYEHIPPRNQISSYRYIRLDSEIAYRASCLLGPVLGPQEIPDCPAPLSKNGYKRTLMKKKKALKASKGRALNTNGHPLMNQRDEPKPIG